uniref:Uncharacterized protein n=1 Tax=Oryza punctata TaxID=4537 RepID=A0A0E0KAP4_ORYPU
MERATVISAGKSWSEGHGVSTEEWTTKVQIKIKNVPEDANHPKKMKSVVFAFCDAQSYGFDLGKKEHTICGFARSVESIPRSKYVKLKYETADGVRIKSFLLDLEACLYVEPEEDNITEGEDPEMYEHPDVVRECFEWQARAQRIADGEESENSCGGSLGMSVDSDWSLKYGGR